MPLCLEDLNIEGAEEDARRAIRTMRASRASALRASVDVSARASAFKSGKISSRMGVFSVDKSGFANCNDQRSLSSEVE